MILKHTNKIKTLLRFPRKTLQFLRAMVWGRNLKLKHFHFPPSWISTVSKCRQYKFQNEIFFFVFIARSWSNKTKFGTYLVVRKYLCSEYMNECSKYQIRQFLRTSGHTAQGIPSMGWYYLIWVLGWHNGRKGTRPREPCIAFDQKMCSSERNAAVIRSRLLSGSDFRDKGKVHCAHEPLPLLAVPTRLSQVMRDSCLWCAWALDWSVSGSAPAAPWAAESLCQVIFRSFPDL